MRHTLPAAILALALGGLAARAAAEEQISNPEYQSWSSFKVGTWVRLETESEVAGSKSGSKMTTKLLELTADKAVLETTIVSVQGGQEMSMPPMKRDVPAKSAKPAEKTDVPPGEKPKEGDEELTIAGKKVQTHWTEGTTESAGTKTTWKSWTSKEVPGGLVKSESKTDMGTMTSVSKTIAAEWKAAE